MWGRIGAAVIFMMFCNFALYMRVIILGLIPKEEFKVLFVITNIVVIIVSILYVLEIFPK